MIISEDVYIWLVSSKLINQGDAVKKGEDVYEVVKTVQSQFENGILFAKIAKYMAKIIAQSQNRPATPLNLDNLKELNSPAAKIYNWNLLTQAFRKFNVTVDSDAKSLIVVGDQETIQLVLFELYQTCMTWTNPVEQSQLYDQNMSYVYQGQQQQANKKARDYKETIDLTKLDPNKDPAKSKTCLEFLIIVLSKHLELDPKQTASLFTHGNKYLAHILAKGVKGLFDPIIEFYTEIYSNLSTLIRLFKEDPTRKSMSFTLNALKPGMVSKSYEVAEWAARLFSRLAFEFGESNLLVHAWEWFVGDGGGLNTTLLSLKRHPDLRSLIVTILLEFALYNFVELFITQLKRALPDPKDLISTQLQLFEPLMKQKMSREEMVQTGILDDWIDLSFTVAGDEFRSPADLKAIALTFLVEVWIQYPQKIEDFEYKANSLVNILAKAARDKFSPLVFSSLGLQFKLLLQFGTDKNPYAPVIYKTLTLALIEHHANSSIREFMLNNFITIYEQLDSIPVNVLLEPFIKQIQVSEQSIFSYNIFDFNFFTYVSKNPKVPIKNAIQLLDLLAKVYLNNIIFAEMSGEPILQIVQNHLDQEIMHEFVIKFVKISLAMYYASEKKKKSKEKILPLYNNQSYNSGRNPQISPQELDNEIIQAQKRSLIVSVIMSVIDLNNPTLNEKILPLVAHSNIQLMKIKGKENKGMMAILAQFGDPEQIMTKFQQEYNEHQSMLKEEEKEALEKEQSMIATIDQKPIVFDSRDETLMLIEANLQKYNSDTNIGKSIVNKISKNELTKLALLRNPRADPKVMKQLDEIKANFSMKQDLEKRIKDNNQSMLVNQKANLRYTIEQRSIEMGVKPLNCKNPIDDRIQRSYAEPRQPIYTINKREKELLREGRMMPSMTYIDLKYEEERDILMVKNLLRTYKKALKFNFQKYAHTGFNQNYQHSNQKLFDEYQDKKQCISVAELWKWIKDYDLEEVRNDKFFVVHQIISHDEHKELVKLVNIYGLGKKNENQELDFKGFKLYFINFCAWVCNKPPANLGHMPLSYSIKYVIDRLKEKTIESVQKYEKARFESVRNPLAMNNVAPLNASLLLYEEPEKSFKGQEAIIETYNKELEQNPEMKLPQGYIKKKEDIITFDYKLNGLKKFSQLFGSEQEKARYETVIKMHELLDEIIMQGLGMKLVEPKSTVKEVIRCYPLVNSGEEAKKHVYDHLKKAKADPEGLEKGGGVEGSSSQPKLPPIDKPIEDYKAFNGKGVFTDHIKKRALLTSQSLYNILPGSTFDVVKPKYGTKKTLPINNYHELSLVMKVEISKFEYKDRWYAEQCATVLDELILDAMENNGFKRGLSYKFHKGIPNPELQAYKYSADGLFHPTNRLKIEQDSKKAPLEEEQRKKDEKIQKWREANLEWAAKEEKVYKAAHLKVNAQMQKESKETKKQQEEREAKEKEEKLKAEKQRVEWLKKQKEKTKEQAEREDKEKALQNDLVKQKEKKVKDEKKVEFDKFNEQRKVEIQKQLEEMEEKRRKEQEQQKKQTKEWQEKKEKLYEHIIENEAKRAEREKQIKEEIKALYESAQVKEVFKLNRKKILTVFELLIKYTFKGLQSDPRKKWRVIENKGNQSKILNDSVANNDPNQSQQPQNNNVSQNNISQGNAQQANAQNNSIVDKTNVSILDQTGAAQKDKKIYHKHDVFHEEINLKTWTWFCYRFSIYPEIINPIDAILIYKSLTGHKVPLDIDPEDPQKVITKAGGSIERGLDYQDFNQALLRVAIKGKKTFNYFAARLQDATLNRSQMQNSIQGNQSQQQPQNGQNGKVAEQKKDPNEAVAQRGLKDFILKNKQLVDEYGKITECTSDTLTCLLFYLGFPNEKRGIEERFRQVMESSTVPDKLQYEKLEEKMLLKNPEEIIELYKLQKQDPNFSIVEYKNKQRQDNNQSAAQNVSQVQPK